MNEERTDQSNFDNDHAIHLWIKVYSFVGILLFGLVLYRLYDIQIQNHKKYRTRQSQQSLTTETVKAPRGDIFDRNGRLLATSTLELSVFADPKLIQNPQSTASVLTQHLNVSKDTLLNKLQKEHDRFVWLKRHIQSETARKLRSLNMKGVEFRREYKRRYPNGTTAAHLLGFVGNNQKGLAGIEYQKEEHLRGEPGKFTELKDGLRNSFRFLRWENRPRRGNNLHLTIDLRIQEILERQLRKRAKKFNPEWASVVMMDSHTGNILGLANYPTFDPNTYQEHPKPHRKNVAITNPVEPGSAFKPFVMSAALEEEKVRPDEKFYCEQGSFHHRGRILHDYKSFGTLTAREIIAKSSNIGMAKIGLRLDEKLRTWVRTFQFGQPTGIQLPGEDPGWVQGKDKWNPIYTQTSVPMGHEIMTTPLQIVRGFSTIANGGTNVSPGIIRNSSNAGNHNKPVISSSTAQKVKEMLRMVVTEGTTSQIHEEGFPMAGKTGTAEKYNAENEYHASFVGLAPYPESRYVVGAFFEKPDSDSGSEVAAPLVKRILKKSKPYLQWPGETVAYQRAQKQIRNQFVMPDH